MICGFFLFPVSGVTLKNNRAAALIGGRRRRRRRRAEDATIYRLRQVWTSAWNATDARRAGSCPSHTFHSPSLTHTYTYTHTHTHTLVKGCDHSADVTLQCGKQLDCYPRSLFSQSHSPPLPLIRSFALQVGGFPVELITRLTVIWPPWCLPGELALSLSVLIWYHPLTPDLIK